MGLIATIVSIAITVASTAYQYQQQKKAQKKAKAAADARKGFELVVEGDMTSLPIAYGRNKIGGARVYHAVSRDFNGAAGNGDYSFARNAGSAEGTKREFLFFQQALAYGGLNRIVDVLIRDEMRLDDPRLVDGGAGYRIDVHNAGGIADAMISRNCPGRQLAKFTNVAYASCMFRLNRDDPEFGRVPDLAFLVEGRRVRKVNAGVLSTTYTYSTNPAWALLDYLLVFRKFNPADLDLTSFEVSAAVCDKIVLQGAAVSGGVFKPIYGTKTEVRDIPLYECNLLLDTTKPFRENVEAILSTMGDARLVWSQGKYSLNLQYPGVNNADMIVADIITDDKLVLGESISVHYPEADERLNKAVVKFSNEALDFKQSTVTWPKATKYTGNSVIPINSIYYPPVSGWNKNGAGTFLNNYGVWRDGESSGKYLWVIVPTMSGMHTLEGFAEKFGSIEIGERTDYSVTSNRNVTASAGSNALMIMSFMKGTVDGREERYYEQTPIGRTVSLVAGQEYVILADVGDSTKGAVGFKLLSPSGAVSHTSRSMSSLGFQTQDFSNDIAVYEAMLFEDNGVELEAETFAEGCTSEYHALAKAEEMVRTSRSASEFEFSVFLEDRYFEPGDVVQIVSESLNLGTLSDVFIKLEKVQPSEDGTCLLKGSRFDWTQLAWNVADDQYIPPNSAFGREYKTPEFLQYLPNLYDTKDSPGSLTWIATGDPAIREYRLFMHVPGELNSDGLPLYKLLGTAVEPPFNIPAMVHQAVIFGIQAVMSSGAVSEMITTSTLSMNPAEPPAVNVLSVVLEGNLNQAVSVSWQIPALRLDGSVYDNHYATEIFRNNTDDFSTAKRIATTLDRFEYTETPTSFGTLYYWVRLISYSGKRGEPSASVTIEYDYYLTQVDTSFEPPPPLNLTAVPMIGGNFLKWTNPSYTASGGHRHTIIFAAPWVDGDEPTFVAAVPLGSIEYAEVFTHIIGAEERWVYWIKSKSMGNAVSGSFAGPVVSTAAVTAEFTMDLIEGQVSESSLALGLAERITLIDHPTNGLVTKVSDLEIVYGDTVSSAASALAAALSEQKAGEFASEAESFKLASETAEGAAEASRSAATISASDAEDSANIAAFSANLSANSATQALLYTGNFEFAEGTEGWSSSLSEFTQLVKPKVPGVVGSAIELAGPNQWGVWARRVPVDPKRIYRIRFRVKSVSGAPSNIYAGLITYNAAGIQESAGFEVEAYPATDYNTLPSVGNWYVYESTITGVGTDRNSFRETTAFASPVFIVNYQQTNAEITHVDECSITDVSESSAAFTSAQTAEAFKTSAGVFAEAADVSKIEAQAARNQASIARADSVSASESATDSAAAASSSAGLSAIARGQAQDARSQAQIARDDAVSARNSAEGSAADASASVSLVVASKGQAEGFAISAGVSSSQAAEYARDAANSAGASAVDFTEIQTSIDNNTAAIQIISESTDGLSAQWTVKTDVNGRVAGIGLLNDEGTPSLFEVLADQFAIFHPGASQRLVFGVANGKTVMSGAYIQDGTIDNAKIGIASIKEANIDNLAVSSAKIANGSITSLKIGNVLQSDNYVNGSYGWQITRAGNVEINNLIARGSIDGSLITGSTIKGSVIQGTAFVSTTEGGSQYLGLISNQSWASSGNLVNGGWAYSSYVNIFSCNYSDTSEYRRFRRYRVNGQMSTSNIGYKYRFLVYNGATLVIDTGLHLYYVPRSGTYWQVSVGTYTYESCNNDCSGSYCTTETGYRDPVFRLVNYPFSGNGQLRFVVYTESMGRGTGSFSASMTAVNDY